jgi:glycosyltransferase involved in cell wall biosynthesis
VRLILTTDTIGGVWTFTKELASGLLRRGHEICLISFGRVPSDGQQQSALDLKMMHPSSFQYQASDLPLEWMQSNEESYTEGASLLLALDKAFGPDAYVLSQYCFGALPVSAPKLIVAHSDVLSWAAACRETLDESSPWMCTYRRLVGDGLEHADAVISPTTAYLKDLRSHFPLLPPLQQVIANGRSVKPELQENRVLGAVTAGRLWDKAKNLRLLTERTLPMPLTIAGESDVVVQSNDELRWVGPQGESALMELFRRNAVYVCTSLYEPFGLTPLEAALCGCAIVAMDIPTLREVWADSAVYFHDADSLMSSLTELSNDEKKLSRLQEMSHERAATYTSSRMADAYLEVLSSLTKKNRHTVEAHAA